MRFMRCDDNYVWIADEGPVACPHCREISGQEYIDVLAQETADVVENAVFDLVARVKEVLGGT